MAPTQPTHRTSHPTKSILKSTTTSPTTSSTPLKNRKKDPPSSLFPTNKSDKRRIKHSALLSRITKSHSTSTSKPRRRRPNKKLVTTLSSLADALPDPSSSADDSTSTPEGNNTNKTTTKKKPTAAQTLASQANVVNVNVIKRKSLKSRPGALRRKQRLDNLERERWGRNVAQLSGGTTTATTNSAQAEGEGVEKQEVPEVQSRWAALRGFIGQTLERREDVSAARGSVSG